MATSFTKKTIAEVLILLAGAAIAATGKQQDSSQLLGLGIAIIGAGVIWGGLGTIRRRQLIFLHREARFMTHRVTGGAAVLWGLLLVLAGVALAAGGIGLAMGYEAALKGLVMQPGVWLLGSGVALSFISAAAFWQQASNGAQSGFGILLAVPGYLFAGVGVLLGIGFAGAGTWGLQDPAALEALGTQLTTTARAWLETS